MVQNRGIFMGSLYTELDDEPGCSKRSCMNKEAVGSCYGHGKRISNAVYLPAKFRIPLSCINHY